MDFRITKEWNAIARLSLTVLQYETASMLCSVIENPAISFNTTTKAVNFSSQMYLMCITNLLNDVDISPVLYWDIQYIPCQCHLELQTFIAGAEEAHH